MAKFNIGRKEYYTTSNQFFISKMRNSPDYILCLFELFCDHPGNYGREISLYFNGESAIFYLNREQTEGYYIRNGSAFRFKGNIFQYKLFLVGDLYSIAEQIMKDNNDKQQN